MYTDVSKYLTDWSVRHFNKKWEGSLTWVRLSIGEDKKHAGKDIIFFNGISYNWSHKWDWMKESISAILDIDTLSSIEKAILDFHWYAPKEPIESTIVDNASVKLEAVKTAKSLNFKFTNKKDLVDWVEKSIMFDMQYIESVKFLKTINKVKSILNNRDELNAVKNLNDTLSGLKLDDTFSYTVKWADGTDRKIQSTTVEHSSVNMTRDKLSVASYFKFRNEFLNQKWENETTLWSKYPVTIVTQEIGYSFSLPIEEEVSILLEKYLKAYSGKAPGKITKFFTDAEEKFLKESWMFSIYPKNWVDMYQFKIYSESGTVQYSINSKDKSLTVSRIGVATADDVDRVRKNLQKIKNELEMGELDTEQYKKLKFKYDKLLEFGKKLNESNKNKKPYFTTFLKIEDPQSLIFKINLVNSYVMSPLKSEKDNLLKNLSNLSKSLEEGKISKDDALGAMNGVEKLYPERTFFKRELKLDKNHVSLVYDARFVSNLLKGDEDKNHKTFKFAFKNKDRETAMLLDLWDIKTLLDNNGEFLKEIKYKLDWVDIYKKFEIDKDLNFSYTDSEDSFTGSFDRESLKKSLDAIKTDLVIQDIYHGNFYNKNYAYLAYKINNFDINKMNDEKNTKKPGKTKLNKF